MTDAEECYNKAIELNPDNAENYFNRGNVKLNNAQYDEAHDDFDRAIALDPENAKLYHAKGLAFQAASE